MQESIAVLQYSPKQFKESRRTKRIDSTDDQNTPEKNIHVQSSNKRDQKINKTKYKTEMCKNFSEMGYCPYRNKCQFAHGQNEICKIEPPAKMFYRTRKCHSFWNQGQCNYGFRCQFSHYSSNKERKQFLQICKFAILNEKIQNKDVKSQSRLMKLLNAQQ